MSLTHTSYNPRRYACSEELERIEERNEQAYLADKQKHAMGADPIAMSQDDDYTFIMAELTPEQEYKLASDKEDSK